MPQYSAWLEAVRYVCTSCVLPAFNDAYCHVPVTEWYQHYLPCYLLPVSNSGLLFFHVDLPGCTVAYWFTQYQISDVAENLGRYFLHAVYRPCEWFGIILTVKVETRHFIEGYFGSEFWAICNHCGVMTANNFCTRCVKIFKILFRTFSLHRRSTLFCSNFVKSFRWEISEIVRYLLHQKNKISAVSQTVATVRIVPKVCQGQLPTMYSRCSRFHPNRFTFGGVIAECMNTVFCPVE